MAISVTVINPPAPNEKIYGDRGDLGLAMNRAKRWFGNDQFEIVPALRPQYPLHSHFLQNVGEYKRYWTRLWAAKHMSSDTWYYITCTSRGAGKVGMQITAYSCLSPGMQPIIEVTEQ